MSTPFEVSDVLRHFSGQAPLFPLPDAVIFPHVLLPLHIFEPRYQKMVADALAGERLIAMASLRPGWEAADDHKPPAIDPIVCLGRITIEQRLPDGRFNLILQGLTRAAVVAEESTDLPYRIGRLKLLPDHYSRKPAIDRRHRKEELLAGFQRMYSHMELDDALHQAFDSEIPLGVVCDVLAGAMRMETDAALEILRTIDVDERSDFLLARLRMTAQAAAQQSTRPFPPPFSVN